MLKTSYRCQPSICDWLSTAFYNNNYPHYKLFCLLCHARTSKWNDDDYAIPWHACIVLFMLYEAALSEDGVSIYLGIYTYTSHN